MGINLRLMSHLLSLQQTCLVEEELTTILRRLSGSPEAPISACEHVPHRVWQGGQRCAGLALILELDTDSCSHHGKSKRQAKSSPTSAM